MRFLFPVMMIAMAVTPGAAQKPLLESSNCPSATSYMAGKGGAWRGEPPKPRKLGELPPGETYAAVYRLDERGCMVPVKYRDVRADRSRRGR